MAAAKQGDRVKIHYTGRLLDDTVFDSSEGREPLEFTVGGNELIPGMANSVVDMEVGAKTTVTIPPEEAYGPVHDELVQKVPMDALPPEVKVGDVLQTQGGDQTIMVHVKEINDAEATLDANHPLAGKTLIFDIELVEIMG